MADLTVNRAGSRAMRAVLKADEAVVGHGVASFCSTLAMPVFGPNRPKVAEMEEYGDKFFGGGQRINRNPAAVCSITEADIQKRPI
jgi:hypothetical protein